MPEELINTNSFELNPPGHYIIDVEELNKKVRTGKGTGRDFVLYELKGQIVECDFEVDTNNFKISMFPNAMTEVLKALGAKEKTPGVYSRPSNEEIKDIRIEFELTHIEDKTGKAREQLLEVRAVVDRNPLKEKKEVAWDE